MQLHGHELVSLNYSSRPLWSRPVLRLLDNDIDLAPVLHGCLYDLAHGIPDSYIAQQSQAALMPALHLLHTILLRSAHGRDIVTVTQGAFHQRATNVACSSEYKP